MQAPPKKELKPEDIIKTYKMIEGDYTVMVRILEANDLVPTMGGFSIFKSKGSACDGFVQVTCHDKKKMTKVKKQQLSPVFNQQFTFKLNNMKKQQLKDAVLTITAYDKKLMAFKNPVIGQYELDLSSIYFSIDHELYHTWLTLSDPNDEREGIMGYILVNVSVLGPNDEPIIHTVSTDKKADASTEKQLAPQKIKQFPHSVNVKLFKGEHMVPMDVMTAKIDAYVQVKYSGIKIKSEVINSRNPEWYQELNLGVMLPNQSRFISFEVFDRDLFKADEMVGCFRVKFKEVYDKQDLLPTWANLYGPPLFGKGSHADLMTLYGDAYGSHYRGRICYQIATYDEPDSKTFKKQLKYTFPHNPRPVCEQKSYVLRVDLIEGHEFPKRDDVYIHVMMGPYQLVSTPCKMEDGTIFFYEQLADKKVLFPTDIEQVPDIIFYFADEHIQDRRHTFYRFKAKELLDIERAPKVIKMKEDRSLGLVNQDEFPGFLYANVQLMSVNPGPRKPFVPNEAEKIEYQLRVNVFLARNLPPAEKSGSCHALVKVRCGGQLTKTKICQQTLNPGWYETLNLNVKLYPLDKPCVVPGGMFVMVFDQGVKEEDGDEVAEELIGRIWITLEPNLITYQQDTNQPEVEMFYRKPKWYNIFYDATDEIQGQILLSYSLIKKEDILLVPQEDIHPETSSTQIHFFCIGLRNINEEIDGIVPENISVSFDVSSDKNQAIYTDKMKIKTCGVNINRLIEIDMEVPNNQNFCSVMDVFTWEETPGREKKLLGTTTIQLSQILMSYYKRRKQPDIAIIEEESENEEQELIAYFEKEREDYENKAKAPVKVAEEGEEEIVEEVDLDDAALDLIDLQVPWELPIKRKLLDEEQYQSRVKQIKEEKIMLSRIVEEEENNIRDADIESENPVYQDTIYQVRPTDGLPAFYPDQWNDYKNLQGQQPQIAVFQVDEQAQHVPSQWEGLKKIQPKEVQFQQQSFIVPNTIGLDAPNNDQTPMLQNQINVNQSVFTSQQKNSQFQQSQKQQPQNQSSYPDQPKSEIQDLKIPLLQQKSSQPSQIQSQYQFSKVSVEEQNFQGQQKPEGYTNPRISMPPPRSQSGDQEVKGSKSSKSQDQDKINQQFSQALKEYTQQLQQQKSVGNNPQIDVKENDLTINRAQQQSSFPLQGKINDSQALQENIFQSRREPSVAGSIHSKMSQNQRIKNGSLYERQASKRNVEIPDQRVAYEEDKRRSQVANDLRGFGSQRSIRDVSDINKVQLIDPEMHYKNQEKKPLLPLDRIHQNDNISVRSLSQKSLQSFKNKSMKQASFHKVGGKNNDNQSVSGMSIKSGRVGSQQLLSYGQQLQQQFNPNQSNIDKPPKFGSLNTSKPPLGGTSQGLITNLPSKKVFNTLKVGSELDFSAASKVSSHALSLASVGSDNMKAKKSGKQRAVKKKKKNFGDRLRGNLDMFGFFKKKKDKKNSTDIETYEEFDTDPGENLSIIPVWLENRPFFKDDLEDFIKPSRKFMKFNLKRGKDRSSKTMFVTEQAPEPEDVCTLKCIFLEEKPGQDSKAIEAKRELYQKLMKPKQYFCRLYILEGVNITTESEDPPDLFLKIRLGNDSFDLEKQTLCVGSVNPQFYLGQEIPCELPGSSFVRIEVYSKNNSLDQPMIGFTEVDLEDRYFSLLWHQYPLKPIECRVLKNDFGTSVGRLQMWIDLVERSQAKANPMVKIEPPPRYEFELRAIVWETKNCVFKNELAKCNDLFGRGGPSNQEFQDTDTHWRCRAKGSFNWRMKHKTFFPMLPEEYGSDQFKIQLWDKDIIGSNELIGETQIDVNTHKMIDKAVKRKKTVKMLQRIRERGGQITDRFWLDVFHPDFVDEEGKKLPQGQVCVSIELLPVEDSVKNQNGLGRDAPNAFPPLNEPTGRLSFDLGNPLQFIKDIMGPDLYQKMCRTLGGCICFGLFIGFGWIFLIQIISGAILKI